MDEGASQSRVSGTCFHLRASTPLPSPHCESLNGPQKVNNVSPGTGVPGRHFYLPLAGQDLFVQLSDFEYWVDSIIGFLEELASELEQLE